ncbi:MAG: hypothetical protein R3F16_10070 [Myxococcota bacterium]
MKPARSFDEVLAALPESTAVLLRRIVEAGTERKAGRLYLVGGPVRDLLLGRALRDVDLAIEGDAAALARAIAVPGEGGPSFTAHDRFGTVRLETSEARVDLAGFRQERYAQPGALPEVEPGDLAADARRRDFSVNALYLPLDAEAPARAIDVIDEVGGLPDLERKRLRVLHPRSFHDDPTRAWRAARFAARLGMRLERGSRNALRDALRDGAFAAVSGERYRRELELVFGEAALGMHVGRPLRSLSDWHVLAALEPGLVLGRDRMVPLRRLSQAIAEPPWPAPRWRPWVAGLSIWLAPLPAALRRRTLERFSVRGEQAARIVRFGRDVERVLRGLERSRGRGSVDATLSELPEETVQALHALAGTAVRRRILRWGAEDRRRRAPVAGTDLVELGLAGPEVGRTLARIRAAFLDGDLANREEALALAVEIARRAAGRSKRSAAAGRRRRRRVAGDPAIADTRAPHGDADREDREADGVSPPETSS